MTGERVLDRPAEILIAAATVAATAVVAFGLPALLRAPDRRATRTALTPSLIILTGGALISFASYLAFTIRCRHGTCLPGAGGGLAGMDRWWRSEGSWQWGAQLAVAAIALLAAAGAFWLAARSSPRGGAVLWTARLLYAGWALVFFVVPAAWELTRV